ncbi:class I adenylate-forming enzyme family protein [Mesorhizobium sp. 1B3]|uniref:class I adenylate-forming enzyme family protein n=1 Tax=Mesorhizobium sp. 1B3 TaxID=3243599 RepID=UPI003D98E757
MTVQASQLEDNSRVIAAAERPLTPSIDAVLARAASTCPEVPAVREWGSGRALTYAQLDGAVSSLARWLNASADLAPGATIAVHLPNSPEFLIAKFAAFRAGGVAAYVNFRLSATEAARQFKLSGAHVVVTTAEKARMFREDAALKDMRFVLSDGGAPLSDSLAEIIASSSSRFSAQPGHERGDALIRFTSGSTGMPKGVIVTHRAWLLRALSILSEEIRIVPQSTTLVLGPLSHQAGLFVLPTFLRCGTLLLVDKFDVDVVATILSQERISCSQMVPTMLGMMMEAPKSREALRQAGLHQLVYGGSPIRASLVDELLDLMPETELVHGYGSHEGGSITYLDGAGHRDPAARHSAGRPFLAAQIRLARANADGVGEIEVNAPWLPHARLTETGRHPIDTPWVATGDLAEIRDGYVFLRDRLNDVIISGGFNVYPAEVERAIDASSAVRGSVVVSAPDDRWGERVVAFVVPRDPQSFDPEALRLHCRGLLAGYKVPKDICVVAEIPLNANGKPDRRRMSDPLWEGRSRRIN